MGKQMEGVKHFDREVEKKPDLLLRARLERVARIKTLRESSGLTTAEFAGECGVTEVTQYNYERGTRVPDADYLDRLHFSRAIDVGELVTGVPKASRGKGYDAETTGVADRFQQLPKLLRKTVDQVLLLAWLAYQDRKSYQDADAAGTLLNPGSEPSAATPKKSVLRKKAAK